MLLLSLSCLPPPFWLVFCRTVQPVMGLLVQGFSCHCWLLHALRGHALGFCEAPIQTTCFLAYRYHINTFELNWTISKQGEKTRRPEEHFHYVKVTFSTYLMDSARWNNVLNFVVCLSTSKYKMIGSRGTLKLYEQFTGITAEAKPDHRYERT